ncbi:hypothetical protein COBT_002960, partial [Conglomerata obtusa]
MEIFTNLYKIIFTTLAIFLFLRPNGYANPLTVDDQYLGAENQDLFAFKNSQSPKTSFNELRNLHNNDNNSFLPKIVPILLKKKKPVISKIDVIKNDIKQIRSNAESEKNNINFKFKTHYNLHHNVKFEIAKE